MGGVETLRWLGRGGTDGLLALPLGSSRISEHPPPNPCAELPSPVGRSRASLKMPWEHPEPAPLQPSPPRFNHLIHTNAECMEKC